MVATALSRAVRLERRAPWTHGGAVESARGGCQQTCPRIHVRPLAHPSAYQHSYTLTAAKPAHDATHALARAHSGRRWTARRRRRGGGKRRSCGGGRRRSARGCARRRTASESRSRWRPPRWARVGGWGVWAAGSLLDAPVRHVRRHGGAWASGAGVFTRARGYVQVQMEMEADKRRRQNEIDRLKSAPARPPFPLRGSP